MKFKYLPCRGGTFNNAFYAYPSRTESGSIKTYPNLWANTEHEILSDEQLNLKGTFSTAHALSRLDISLVFFWRSDEDGCDYPSSVTWSLSLELCTGRSFYNIAEKYVNAVHKWQTGGLNTATKPIATMRLSVYCLPIEECVRNMPWWCWEGSARSERDSDVSHSPLKLSSCTVLFLLQPCGLLSRFFSTRS